MSTYNNVHIACLKHEITIWRWEQVNAAWLEVPQKVREMSEKQHCLESGNPVSL